jgi:DNA-binding NarL/FixJ family response regulator
MLTAELLRFLEEPTLCVGLFVPRLAALAGLYVNLGAPQPARKSCAELGLSPRQKEVLQLLLEGLPNKLIARKLNISENTTKIHVSAVLRALGVSTRTQALIAATRLGLEIS